MTAPRDHFMRGPLHALARSTKRAARIVGFLNLQDNSRRVQDTRGHRDKGVEYLAVRATVAERCEFLEGLAGSACSGSNIGSFPHVPETKGYRDTDH
jgi:hypothetical protein